MSAAFSATARVLDAVCPPGRTGMTEESQTRRLLTPMTLRLLSTTARSSAWVPSLQVPTRALAVCTVCLAYCLSWSSEVTWGPGNSSGPAYLRRAGCRMMPRAFLRASTMTSRSFVSEKKGVSILGFARGSDEVATTFPRFDTGLAQMVWMVNPLGWFGVGRYSSAIVDMPSGVMDLVARKRIWTSGSSFREDWEEDLKKPPWSQPGDVRGPRPAKSHLTRATGFVSVVPGIRSFVE
mmetsp:Transcript_31907/g.102068  ORF Transcript_31907/g.102068 Transcript_31907/m.102068 type:complete len:237 (+) Transcript_31907:219-929(+)